MKKEDSMQKENAGGVYAVIFSDRQLVIFEKYKKNFGFNHSADA